MKERNTNFFLKINVVINLKTLIICPPVFLNKQHENSRCVIFIHRALPCENCLCYSEFLFSQITLRQLKVEADQYPKLLPRETRFILGNFRVLPSLLPGNCRGYQLTFTKRTIDHGTIAGGDTVVSKTFE